MFNFTFFKSNSTSIDNMDRLDQSFISENSISETPILDPNLNIENSMNIYKNDINHSILFKIQSCRKTLFTTINKKKSIKSATLVPPNNTIKRYIRPKYKKYAYMEYPFYKKDLKTLK
jgi:hypothetical protein